MPAGGDKILITDLSAVTAGGIAKPICRLLQTSAQSVANSTNTPITFTSETIDTDNFFNAGTSTTRVTPTKAGYYRVAGTLVMSGVLTYAVVAVFVRKNGATLLGPGGRMGGLGFQGSPASTPTAQYAAVNCTLLIDCNGTTDYLELCAYQQNTGSAVQNTFVSGQFSSAFEVEFVRGL